MPNVLVATLGATWQVVPELVGYTNAGDLPLYRASRMLDEVCDSMRGIGPIDELWLVTTDSKKGLGAAEELFKWNRVCGRPALRIWCLEGIGDIASPLQSLQMADLIYRMVLHAHDAAGDGHVVLSLAGGRKTMSAELQQAGRVFGCSAMLHVVDSLPPDRNSPQQVAYGNLQPSDWTKPLPDEIAACFHPVVIGRDISPFDWIDDIGSLCAQFPLSRGEATAVGYESPRRDLYDEVDRLLQDASQLYENYRQLHLEHDQSIGNFRALYVLPRRDVSALQHDRIGSLPERRDDDLQWLVRLPKAELHCHLGGILTAAEMITVAQSIAGEVAQHRSVDHKFDREIREIENAVEADSVDRIESSLGIEPKKVKYLRERWSCRAPVGVAAFLLAFRAAPDLLDQWLFREYVDVSRFRRVKFGMYERLGDLQGSGLLQCRETIRAAIQVLGEQCRADNITYLELRCSPLNCTGGGLSGEQVVDEILSGIERIDWCDVRLIFIGSRHGDASRIEKHIELAVELLGKNETFARRFVGFDLAGDEKACEPVKLRPLFAPLRERVIRVTIHAGEGTSVDHIWQAVYELSADRIGHGLLLDENPRLARRFRDRSIAVELCPSSNDQIIGYRDSFLGDDDDWKAYPVSEYLKQGLRVTINTDNPGISRTTLSREYLKAAAMTEGGLTKWQVLQLIRNGFRSAFCDYETRRRMLIKAEQQIMRMA